MRITTKGRYGLRAVLILALSQDEKPVPIRYIAEKENLSPEFLEQLFFKLKKNGDNLLDQRSRRRIQTQ